MSINLTGKNLTIEDVVRVARHGEKVEVDPDALELLLHPAGPLPSLPRLRAITHDFLGQELDGETALAGPFASPSPQPTPVRLMDAAQE